MAENPKYWVSNVSNTEEQLVKFREDKTHKNRFGRFSCNFVVNSHFILPLSLSLPYVL